MSAAARAFDMLAPTYDEIFTESSIGSAQRRAVWNVMEKTFRPGDRVLELNCGTGKDALFLASRGVAVIACDASPGMIAVAERRKQQEPRVTNPDFRIVPSERIDILRREAPFDGVLSNFGGLNCVQDLAALGRQLQNVVRPGGRMLFCFANRYCLWEFCWYVASGDPAKAVRRWSGETLATIAGAALPVWYPTIRQVRRSLSSGFCLRRMKAIGLAVPPSYVEHLASRHPAILAACARFDTVVGDFPGLRAIGDHILLEFERNSE